MQVFYFYFLASRRGIATVTAITVITIMPLKSALAPGDFVFQNINVALRGQKRLQLGGD